MKTNNILSNRDLTHHMISIGDSSDVIFKEIIEIDKETINNQIILTKNRDIVNMRSNLGESIVLDISQINNSVKYKKLIIICNTNYKNINYALLESIKNCILNINLKSYIYTDCIELFDINTYESLILRGRSYGVSFNIFTKTLDILDEKAKKVIESNARNVLISNIKSNSDNIINIKSNYLDDETYLYHRMVIKNSLQKVREIELKKTLN